MTSIPNQVLDVWSSYPRPRSDQPKFKAETMNKQHISWDSFNELKRHRVNRSRRFTPITITEYPDGALYLSILTICRRRNSYHDCVSLTNNLFIFEQLGSSSDSLSISCRSSVNTSLNRRKDGWKKSSNTYRTFLSGS